MWSFFCVVPSDQRASMRIGHFAGETSHGLQLCHRIQTHLLDLLHRQHKVDLHYQISRHSLLKGIKTTWSSPLPLGGLGFPQASSQSGSGIEQRV